MKYFELRVTVLLKENIKTIDIGQVLGRHINYCMSMSEILKDIHSGRLPKLYCYDYLFPLERHKVYQANKVYVFKMRTPKEYIAREMKRVLGFYNTDKMRPLGCDLRVKRFYRAEEVSTVTPAITTVDNKNWIVGDDFDLLWKRIDQNLEKKYKLLFDEPIDIMGSSIELLDIKNKKPIVMNYKDNGKILGNKFSLMFKSDEKSQKLAYIAITTGILEKNSAIGGGFCVMNKRR